MELIGERWALLVIRDLFVAPKSFAQLRSGLRRIPPATLAARSRSLGEPRPDDVVTADSMIMALRTTFRPEAARGLHAGYELRLGPLVIHARVDDGVLLAGEGPLPGRDLVIEPGTALRALMAGELDPRQAVESGTVRINGDPALLTRFTEIFTFRAEPALVGS